MKTKILSTLAALCGVVLFASCAAQSAASSAKQAEETAMVKQKIGQMNFTIDVNSMQPLGARSRSLTGGYNLIVEGNQVRSYLPFMGRGYGVPLGGGEGLHFRGDVDGYRIETAEDGYLVTFTAKTLETSYFFSLDISANGIANIVVSPANKQTVSFSGMMELD